MCDFSLHAVRSRPAKVGDKLTTRMFNLGTGGFCAPEDMGIAVCLLPGTELSFTDEVRRWSNWLTPMERNGDQLQDSDLQTDQQGQAGHPSRCAGISKWRNRSSDNPRRRPAGNGAATASGTRKSKGAEEPAVSRAARLDWADAMVELEESWEDATKSPDEALCIGSFRKLFPSRLGVFRTSPG